MIPAHDANLSDAQLEKLVLAWMAQELAIAPEGAEVVLRLSGRHGLTDPLPRARALELASMPEDLRETSERLDAAVGAWLDAYLLDILASETYAVPVSDWSLHHATGLPPEDLAYFFSYLQAVGIGLSRSPHHWPGYSLYHLDPIFVDQYAQDIRNSYYAESEHGGTVGDRLMERLERAGDLARNVAQYCIGTALPPEPGEALAVLMKRFGATANEVLGAERLLLAEHEASLEPLVTFSLVA